MEHWTTGQVLVFFFLAAALLFLAVWGGYEWAWHRRGEGYRSMVSASRLAIRQERRAKPGPDLVVHIHPDTSSFDQAIADTLKTIKRVEAERATRAVRDAGD